MMLLICLALFALAEGTAPSCDYVVIHETNYEKHIIMEHIPKPYQLAVDYQTNTLFFSYSKVVRERTLFNAAFLNMNTNKFSDIPPMHGAFSNAYDRNTHTMYLGGEHGMFTINYTTKRAKDMNITDMKICQMFFSPMLGLFFITYKPAEKAFVYKDGVVKPVAWLNDTYTRHIAVGEYHDIFFANTSGLFMYKTSDKKVITLGDYEVNGFASDVTGKLCFSTLNGVYYVNESQKKIDVLFLASNGDTISGVTLDGSGSIIYALNDSIIKLVPTIKKC